MREHKKFYDIHYTFVESIYNIEDILKKKLIYSLVMMINHDLIWFWSNERNYEKTWELSDFSYSEPCLLWRVWNETQFYLQYCFL